MSVRLCVWPRAYNLAVEAALDSCFDKEALNDDYTYAMKSINVDVIKVTRPTLQLKVQPWKFVWTISKASVSVHHHRTDENHVENNEKEISGSFEVSVDLVHPSSSRGWIYNANVDVVDLLFSFASNKSSVNRVSTKSGYNSSAVTTVTNVDNGGHNSGVIVKGVPYNGALSKEFRGVTINGVPYTGVSINGITIGGGGSVKIGSNAIINGVPYNSTNYPSAQQSDASKPSGSPPNAGPIQIHSRFTTPVTHSGIRKSIRSIDYDASIRIKGINQSLTSSGNDAVLVSDGIRSRVVSSGDVASIACSGIDGSVNSTGADAYIIASGNGQSVTSRGKDAVIVASGNRPGVTSSGDVASITSSGNSGSVNSTGADAYVVASGNNQSVTSRGKDAVIDASGNSPEVVSSGEVASIACSGNNGSVDSTGADAYIIASGIGQSVTTRGKDVVLVSSGIRPRVVSSGDVASITCSGMNGSIDSTGADAYIISSSGVTIKSSGPNASIHSSGGEVVINSSGPKAQIHSSGSKVVITSSGANGLISASGVNATIKSTGTNASISNSGTNTRIQSSGSAINDDLGQTIIRRLRSAIVDSLNRRLPEIVEGHQWTVRDGYVQGSGDPAGLIHGQEPQDNGRMITLLVSSDSIVDAFRSACPNMPSCNLTQADLNGQPSGNNSSSNVSRKPSCLSDFFPDFSNKYPGSSVEVNLRGSQAPTASFSDENLKLTFPGSAAVLRALLPDGSTADCLTTEVNMEINVLLELNPGLLRGIVTSIISKSITVVETTLDSVNQEALKDAFDHISTVFLTKKFDEICQRGIPLPRPLLAGFTEYENVVMSTTADGCLRMDADIKFSA